MREELAVRCLMVRSKRCGTKRKRKSTSRRRKRPGRGLSSGLRSQTASRVPGCWISKAVWTPTKSPACAKSHRGSSGGKTARQVILRLESPGGVVHGYGLAASQLQRLRDKQIPLTVAVDKVAASGGYMMACVANKIVAAPFAILGSIGVVAQIPNLHRFLKNKDIDIELHTAGQYKRTLTMLGENTDEGRRKFREDLNETHQLFKDFVHEMRPSLDIEAVATGEHWYGVQALEKGLVDLVETSDELLLGLIDHHDVIGVRYQQRKKMLDRFTGSAAESADRLLLRWWQRGEKPLM